MLFVNLPPTRLQVAEAKKKAAAAAEASRGTCSGDMLYLCSGSLLGRLAQQGAITRGMLDGFAVAAAGRGGGGAGGGLAEAMALLQWRPERTAEV